MSAPTYLKHKPILEVSDYDKIDGVYANKTDAKALSIGIAQWNSLGQTDLSAKVWRHVGEKWSRQSEELPLHRVLDLASLICITMGYNNNAEITSTETFPVKEVTADNNSDLHLELMEKELEKNKEHLDISLKRLADELKRLGY